LNYSYPPLLYQRGDEDEEEQGADESDDEYNSHIEEMDLG